MLASLLLGGLTPSAAAVVPAQIALTPECGAAEIGRAACGAAALRTAEDELAAARRGAAMAIAATGDRLEPEERESWLSAFNASMALWLAFRDARCDPQLIDYEAAETAAPTFSDAPGCARAITRVMAGDVTFRYDLDRGAVPRESAIQSLAGAVAAMGDAEEGPCTDVDPGECDYCGANRCWEGRLIRADRDLKRAWDQAVQAIRQRPDLAADRRADWIGRLRTVQRAWRAWRDSECALEPWETPNRFAHSVYATLVAPCIEGETLARIDDLAASSRPVGR